MPLSFRVWIEQIKEIQWSSYEALSNSEKARLFNEWLTAPPTLLPSKPLTTLAGLDIEPKIRPLVEALNQAGIRTTQSCQGHFGEPMLSTEWRGNIPYPKYIRRDRPWVEIEKKDENRARRLTEDFNRAKGTQWTVTSSPFSPLEFSWITPAHDAINYDEMNRYHKEVQEFAEYLKAFRIKL